MGRCYKKTKFLIRIGKERLLFEVGIVLRVGHLFNTSLFVGLIKRDTIETGELN